MKALKKMQMGVLLVAGATATLTACTSVSEEEEVACVAAGGSVTHKEAPYGGKGFFKTSAGSYLTCSTPKGYILKVYQAKEVTEVSTKWWRHTSKENRFIFEECKALEGVVFEQDVSRGDEPTDMRFACLSDGEFVQLLK